MLYGVLMPYVNFSVRSPVNFNNIRANSHSQPGLLYFSPGLLFFSTQSGATLNRDYGKLSSATHYRPIAKNNGAESRLRGIGGDRSNNM